MLPTFGPNSVGTSTRPLPTHQRQAIWPADVLMAVLYGLSGAPSTAEKVKLSPNRYDMLPAFGGMEGRMDTTAAESGDTESSTITSAATTL